MPLQKIIISSRSKLYLWHISETTTELLAQFTETPPQAYQNYRSTAHQQQFLAKKLLLQYLHIDDKLIYLASGKPVLSDKNYISISHSRNWVAIALSSQEIGIDMETAHPKLIKIAPKFVHDAEKEIFDIHQVTDLQYLWTAKESIYKLAGKKGLRFKEDILIHEFDTQTATARARLLNSQEIYLFFNRISPDFIISQAFFNK